MFKQICCQDGIDICVCECSKKSVVRELKLVFPDFPGSADSVRALVYVQQTDADLTMWGDEQAAEKDAKLAQFVDWAKPLVGRLRAEFPGAWADASDPASGVPLFGDDRGGTVLSDVDVIQSLLPTYYGFMSVDCGSLGACRLVSHPKWKQNCYPALLFTTASIEQVLDVMSPFC